MDLLEVHAAGLLGAGRRLLPLQLRRWATAVVVGRAHLLGRHRADLVLALERLGLLVQRIKLLRQRLDQLLQLPR